MKILVIGGTKFFGIPMIKELLANGHAVTIATRGNTLDPFGDSVSRIKMDRQKPTEVREQLSEKLSFIHENEAGGFIAWLVDHSVQGAVNGCSNGSVSLKDIISYIEKKTGRKAILSKEGESAPFNGCKDDLTLDISKAEKSGYCFSGIESWIYDLIDWNTEQVKLYEI